MLRIKLAAMAQIAIANKAIDDLEVSDAAMTI